MQSFFHSIRVLPAVALLSVPGLLWAQLTVPVTPSEPAPEPSLNRVSLGLGDAKAPRWVVGLMVTSGPAFAGASSREVSARPILSGQVGRWTVSTSAARRISGQELAGGVSTTVLEHQRWQMALGLRLTHGRDSGDDLLLAGMPNIPSSLNLRVSARYQLTSSWQWTHSLQQDIGHAQGMRWVSGLGWQHAIAPGWGLDAGVGITWANARAMRVFHGVPSDQATASRPVWQTGAGLEQWGWGVGVTHALSSHWRLSANVGRSTLLGDAARSPLTQQRQATQAQLGLAYVGW